MYKLIFKSIVYIEADFINSNKECLIKSQQNSLKNTCKVVNIQYSCMLLNVNFTVFFLLTFSMNFSVICLIVGATISDKNYGKNYYFGNFMFPLNNVEKQREKPASSYVMGSQH